MVLGVPIFKHFTVLQCIANSRIKEQSDQGLHCFPFYLHLLHSLLNTVSFLACLYECARRSIVLLLTSVVVVAAALTVAKWQP